MSSKLTALSKTQATSFAGNSTVTILNPYQQTL